jgi:tetratricopeptide (TPR) repeat protein
VLVAGCQFGAAKTEALLKQADDAFAAQKFNDAYALYVQVLQRNPKDDKILTSLGICSLELKDSPRGIAWIDQALAINPNNSLAWEKRGELVMGQGRLKEAIPYFDKSLALDANMNAARLNLALIYERLGQVDQALALGSEAVSREPKDAETHYKYAVTLEIAKRFDDAEAQYREALTLKKDHVHSLIRLSALLVARKKDLGEARTMAQEANKLEPGDGDPALLAAWALFLSGDQKSGVREMEQVARAHPSNWQAWARLAMGLKEIGATDASKQAAKIAASIAPRPLAVLDDSGKTPAGKAPAPVLKGAR